jgi:6-phosphogluconolactonase
MKIYGFLLYALAITSLEVVVSSAHAQFVYVVNQFDSTIGGYSVDPTTGALTQISGSPFPTGQEPGALGIDPTGSFLYDAIVPSAQANGQIYGYSIDKDTGALTQVPGSPTTTGDGPGWIGIDPLGRYVYVPDSDSSYLSGFKIDMSTGALAAIKGSPFSAGNFPASAVVDPTASFLYVANSGGSTVWAYKLDKKTGVPTVSGSPFGTGDSPVAIAVSPTGKFVYTANYLSNNVSAYSIDDKNGSLTSIPGSPFPAGNNPIFVAIDPTGKFAYVANSSDNTVSGYQINQKTGALTPVQYSPFATGYAPYSVAVDSSGQFLYVANLNDSGYPPAAGSISGYSIDCAGILTPLTGSPFPAGKGPYSIVITPHK